MRDRIDIDPSYPLSRFTILPESWTGYTSAAALCLVLPIYHTQNLTPQSREVLLAGIDRYTGNFNEGDAADLVARAEAYLGENLDARKGHTLGELREMLRLHAGRLLEGRSREALTSATYLAVHVLSACSEPPAVGAEALWVLNEAMLDARPISSIYTTVDGQRAQDIYLNLQQALAIWGSGAYVHVPVGDRNTLFQLTQFDAMSFINLMVSGYGLDPSWPLSSSRRGDEWAVPFGHAVEVLIERAFPALTELSASEPEIFATLPEIFCEVLVEGSAASAPNDDVLHLLMSLELENPAIGVRVFEFILGELRHLDLAARRAIYEKVCIDLSAKRDDPAGPLYATIALGVLGLGASALDYERKYFMTPRR